MMTRIFTGGRALPQQIDSIDDFRSSQADTHLGAGDLQRPGSYPNNLSNLIAANSSLYEIEDLLYPFWSELGQSSMNGGL